MRVFVVLFFFLCGSLVQACSTERVPRGCCPRGAFSRSEKYALDNSAMDPYHQR